MGKRLIVKGADFSANGIYTPNLTLLDVMPLELGKAWASYGNASPYKASDNSKRASQSDYVDISQYGFGAIKLTAKPGYKFVAYFGNTYNKNVADANLSTWVYTTSNTSLELDITGITYAVIMVAANDDSVLTSTDWSTYITAENPDE